MKACARARRAPVAERFLQQPAQFDAWHVEWLNCIPTRRPDGLCNRLAERSLPSRDPVGVLARANCSPSGALQSAITARTSGELCRYLAGRSLGGRHQHRRHDDSNTARTTMSGPAGTTPMNSAYADVEFELAALMRWRSNSGN